jgi:glycerophosphoryl diester phosphodiesterase
MPSGREPFLLIGHRGLREKYVENTRKSFSGAESEGIDGVELDVQLSRDRKIIVFHDYDSSRLLGVNGKIYDLKYGEISKMKIKGSNEYVPTLEDILDVTPNLILFIELKTIDDHFSEVNKGIEEEVVSLLNKSGRKKFYIISFNPSSLIRVKKLDPKIRTGLLVDNETLHMHKNVDSKYLRSIGADLLLPSFELKSERWVEESRDGGSGIIFWNVFDYVQAKTAKEFCSIGVITDFPLAIRKQMR